MTQAPAIPHPFRAPGGSTSPSPAPAAPGHSFRALRRPGRSGAAEVAAGALLVLLWALLWSVFVSGVLAPADRLGAVARQHPSLAGGAGAPASAASVAPRGDAVRAVDTAGTPP